MLNSSLTKCMAIAQTMFTLVAVCDVFYLPCKILKIVSSEIWDNLNPFAVHFTFTFIHLADAFIQSDLQM